MTWFWKVCLRQGSEGWPVLCTQPPSLQSRWSAGHPNTFHFLNDDIYMWSTHLFLLQLWLDHPSFFWLPYCGSLSCFAFLSYSWSSVLMSSVVSNSRYSKSQNVETRSTTLCGARQWIRAFPVVSRAKSLLFQKGGEHQEFNKEKKQGRRNKGPLYCWSVLRKPEILSRRLRRLACFWCKGEELDGCTFY